MKKPMLSVGYKKWALWLSILFLLCLTPIFALMSYFMIDKQSVIGFLFFGTVTLVLAGSMVVSVAEIMRNGVAVSVSREGILLYQVSDQIIPWDKITSVEVHSYEITDVRCYIEIKCKVKIIEFHSPYLLTNLYRLLTLGHFRNTLTMDLSGVDGKDKDIRGAIRTCGPRNILV